MEVGVRIGRDPLECEFLLQVVEREGLCSDFVKTDSIPLFDDFAIDFKGRALAATVVLSDHLMQESKDEQLEGHPLDDVVEDDHVVALAHRRDVILLDRRSLRQDICEDLIDRE